MKNKILFTILLFGLISLFSCKPESINIPANEFSDVFITWSPLTINVNGEVSIADGSRGVKKRLWTISGDGVDILRSDNDETSTDRIIYATFSQPGVFNVRLQSEFDDPKVTLDSIITVNVLDNVSAKFTSDAQTQNGKFVVKAGGEVKYSSVSTGSPNSFEWSFTGGNIEKITGSTAIVQYNQLGTWDVSLIAYRNNPKGRDTIIVKDFITVIE